MPQARVNGTTLHYEEKGEGVPLLFIHGMCGDARVWEGQMKRLSGRFRCVAYDRRGHSHSPLGEVQERTVQLHADDAAGLIQALDLAPCVIVGSSGGARVGLDLVRRHPELLRGAVLSEPPLFALNPSGAAAMLGRLRPAVEQAVAEGGPRAAVDAFFAFMCPGLWQRIPEASRDLYRDNQAELWGDLQMPPYQLTEQELQSIDQPCLLIRGSESLPVLRDITGTLARNLPGSRLVELYGSGHVTYFERPAEFAATVTVFVDSLAARLPEDTHHPDTAAGTAVP